LQKLYTSATTNRAAPRHHRYMSSKIDGRKMMLALAAILTATGIGGYAQSTASIAEIQMTAEKYDFIPDTVTVKKGDRVKLVLKALDHDHGIKIEAFHLNQKLPKGEPVTVEFVADQAGTFPFQCSQFCGLGHKKMKGTLVVE
jgi:heme/copper-type cytochrome/quinol oxidase subunit 2